MPRISIMLLYVSLHYCKIIIEKKNVASRYFLRVAIWACDNAFTRKSHPFEAIFAAGSYRAIYVLKRAS